LFTCGCWRIQELFGGGSEPACSFIASAAGQRPVMLFAKKKQSWQKRRGSACLLRAAAFFKFFSLGELDNAELSVLALIN
jgi:hypothetical protein